MDYNRTPIRPVGGGFNAGTTSTARVAADGAITLSGTQTIDGIVLTVGNTCLVTAQASGSDNGLYLVASGVWTRTTDLIKSGMIASVREGNKYASSAWCLTTASPIGVGTTVLTWKIISVPTNQDLRWANCTSAAAIAPSGTPTYDGIATKTGSLVLMTNPVLTGGLPGLWKYDGASWNLIAQPYGCLVLQGTTYAGVQFYDANPDRSSPPTPVYTHN